MRRFLTTTGSFVLALLLAILLAEAVGVLPIVLPAAQEPIVCPDGTVATWSSVQNQVLEVDMPNLSCRDEQGRPHGPNFNWMDDHLYGLSFWDHGQRVGATVVFHDNRGVWIVRDESVEKPFSMSWSEAGVKVYEEIQDGSLSHSTLWHENGNLESQLTLAGESDPFWLPDGSFNEEREDHTYLVGEYRSYYENGRPRDIGSYRNGARDGDWTCSDESGKHVVFATFSKGRLVSRTGDVDAESMQDRCKERVPCRRSDEPAIAENRRPGQSGRCAHDVS